ncbi:hypothetical protein [Streptomyces poonensis]|uniref:Uncharacterized protein n=1 Tax=Streptomyces poonensis TaxID=68255 RepID=A0A918Q448_9ACTN|nr:hypothetical protein [Streptomyces poonensis]GGZ32284.1 hypothetical protein GCM10010365_61300 [Streptomyces poonensis]GLJ92799.1 hypothetical protein GCM10017589_54090 [Streptomyces poonensis]
MRVGITGHRGLPTEVAVRVQDLLTEQLKAYDPRDLTAISCIADGPDSWWARMALGVRARLEVVIPATEYRDGPPPDHHPVYDELLNRADEVHKTGMTASTSEAHQAGSELLVGLSDEVLAVWDGLPARGYGGTADVVAYARRVGVPVTVLWPKGASR